MSTTTYVCENVNHVLLATDATHPLFDEYCITTEGVEECYIIATKTYNAVAVATVKRTSELVITVYTSPEDKIEITENAEAGFDPLTILAIYEESL